MTSFRDYTAEMGKWITVVEGDFYPDSLEAAIPIYEPVLQEFTELVKAAADSEQLLRHIARRPPKKRIQLMRVFRKYVSPDTSVEMLKKVGQIDQICRDFGNRFRGLETVRAHLQARPLRDEALIALLNEYRERGQKGYSLTGTFFDWFETNLGDDFSIRGPTGAGRDINLYDCFPDYPKDRRPVDFIITEKGRELPLVIGLVRYDSDRGGAQEDDRTSGYRNVVVEVVEYSAAKQCTPKLVFINDGPGLLLGSMWKDYCELEDFGKGRVMVATLKMLPHRLTPEWLRS